MSEPWLSGSLAALHPGIAAVLYSLKQIQEDLGHWTAGIADEQVWATPHGLAPLGFQIRHIAGSIDRLFTYAEGGTLSETQLATLRAEQAQPGATLSELLAAVDEAIGHVSDRIGAIDTATLVEPRKVGRKQLPTTVQGLLFHLAEHGQRHLGEAIITCKVLKAVR